MKKYLLFILTLFVFMNNVSAETTIPDNVEVANSCSINLYKPITDTTFTSVTYDYSNKKFVDFDSNDSARYSNILIPVKPNTSYYMNPPTGGKGKIMLYFLDENLVDVGSLSSFNLYYGSSITTPDNAKYLLFFNSKGYEANITGATNVMLFEGTESTDYVAYEECSTPDPEPEKPDLEGMETVSNFFVVYLTKIQEFGNYIVDSPMFLTVLCLILFFIIIDFFFLLFIRR